MNLARVRGEPIVGRTPELAALSESVPERRSLVLTGGPGIGKTTLWEAGVDAAREQGMRVLSARPTGAEAQLSFAALIDLCDEIDAADLPAPQRSALEVALLRAPPGAAPPEPHAIGLGLLSVLRRLSGREPLLVAIDDVQWLDAPSSAALTFAARRLEDERVSFLLAKRPGRVSALEQAIERRGLERLTVRPLSFGAIRRLLAERLGLTLSRHLLRRITDSTLGNPLFALELGRTLAEQGMPELGEDLPVPDAVEDVLGTRVARLPDAARGVLLAVALSGELRTGELAAVAGQAAVDDARDAGVLVADGDRVRAAHPLLAAAAKKRSRVSERRALHLALAGAVEDAELRALHLALSTAHADPQLSAVVAEAAALAAARGARQEAVQLAEHALRLAPADSEARSERLLALGAYLEVAGEVQRISDLLRPELDSFAPGAPRARAWLLLAEGGDVRTLPDLLEHLDRAFEEGRDEPGLRAEALAKKSIHACASAVSRVRLAQMWALEAVSDARAGAAGAERLALTALAWAHILGGRPIDELCARYDAVSDAAPFLAESPERLAGLRLSWRGDMREARPALMRLLALADEQGEPVSYAIVRAHLCDLELRAGEWDAAARLLAEWAESSERHLIVPPMYERAQAQLAVGRGLPDEAASWAQKALEACAATGSRWEELDTQVTLGTVALLAHEPAQALGRLRPVWEHTVREGVEDPGMFPVAPELVEALVLAGELDEARTVVRRLRDLSERQEHPWGLATAKRCAAVIELAADEYDEGRAAALHEAAEAYAELGLRFDHARTLLALGRAQRRRRKWRAARGSLERAVAAFEALGSPGWAGEARSQLERVGARGQRAAGELTPSEARVVALAAEGRSNKEIAGTLFVTVHTVEVHLSKAYRKLGVSSRGQLAARLAAEDQA